VIPTPWKNPPEGLVAVGEVLTTQGIKGEVKIAPLTDSHARWHELNRVFACFEQAQTQTQTKLFIEKVRFFRQFVIAKFEGINTVNEAERLRGVFIWIPRAERPALPENSFYIDQILGLRVYNEAQQYLGAVQEVIPTGANDVYVLQGGVYGEILLPALKSVVLSVELSAGRMMIRLPAGLVEGEE